MSFYPRPSGTGGVLIRKVMGLAKSRGLALPIRDPVLIAVSGGVDSMVLAHLLARYGRNFVDPAKITFLHLDHGWRPESAGVERTAVERMAAELGVAFLHQKLPPPLEEPSLNREEDARKKRIHVYDELAGEGRPHRWVLTAHHQDDVSETLFWRFLRGEFDHHREGILFRDCQCLRPFLHVKKEEIRAYASEEGVVHHEDPTNSDPRHFRAWMRERVFPLLESGFPAVRETVAEYARRAESDSSSSELEGLRNLLAAVTRGPLNRSQREALTRMLHATSEGATLFLPGGVQLKRLKQGWLIENSDRPIEA
jgi:tRNA(Ile)-lysidine synthase